MFWPVPCPLLCNNRRQGPIVGPEGSAAKAFGAVLVAARVWAVSPLGRFIGHGGSRDGRLRERHSSQPRRAWASRSDRKRLPLERAPPATVHVEGSPRASRLERSSLALYRHLSPSATIKISRWMSVYPELIQIQSECWEPGAVGFHTADCELTVYPPSVGISEG